MGCPGDTDFPRDFLPVTQSPAGNQLSGVYTEDDLTLELEKVP